jgi:RHS repeat-associated protein
MLAITPQAHLTTTSFRAAPSQTEHYSVHTDHQGSVRAVTDLSGLLVNTYAYDAYGNAEAAVESLPQPYRYTGREWDGVTRLYHYRARAYDPETGRFLQEDPIGLLSGDANFYRYVKNNPVNFVDPSGITAAGEEGSVDSIGTTATPGIFNTARQLACSFQTIAGVLDVIGAPGIQEITLLTDADLGCGARAKGFHQVSENFEKGKDAERLIEKWLRNISDFDCDEKTAKHYRPTGLGKRFVDSVVCFGEHRIAIEVKTGNAPYLGTLQHEKDKLLVETNVFTRIIAIRLKTFAEYVGQ